MNVVEKRESGVSRFRVIATPWLILAVATFSFTGCGKTEAELMEEGTKLFLEGNILGAIIAFKDLVEKYPDSEHSTEARLGLAQCYLTDRDYGSTRDVLDEVLANVEPESQSHIEALLLKAKSYQLERNLTAALETALLATDAISTAIPFVRNNGRWYVADLMQLNELPDDALQILGSIIEYKVETEADTSFHLRTLARMAGIYATQDDLDGAFDLHQKYLEDHPDSSIEPELYKQMGRIRLRQERTEESDQAFDRADALLRATIENTIGADEKSTLMMRLADLLKVRGRLQESHDLFQKVADDYPLGTNRGLALIYLSDTVNELGDPDRALSMLEEIARDYQNLGLMVMGRARAISNARAAAERSTETLMTETRAADEITTTSKPVAGASDSGSSAETVTAP